MLASSGTRSRRKELSSVRRRTRRGENSRCNFWFHSRTSAEAGAPATTACAGRDKARASATSICGTAVGARVSPLVIREMVVTVVLNALLAIPVFVGIRRLLRPSLTVDPLELGRRRQAPRSAGPIGLRGLEI